MSVEKKNNSSWGNYQVSIQGVLHLPLWNLRQVQVLQVLSHVCQLSDMLWALFLYFAKSTIYSHNSQRRVSLWAQTSAEIMTLNSQAVTREKQEMTWKNMHEKHMMRYYSHCWASRVKEIGLQTFVKTSQQTCQFFKDFGYEPQTSAQTSLPNLSKDGLKDSADLPFSFQTKTNIVEPDTENTPTLVYRQPQLKIGIPKSAKKTWDMPWSDQL